MTFDVNSPFTWSQVPEDSVLAESARDLRAALGQAMDEAVREARKKAEANDAAGARRYREPMRGGYLMNLGLTGYREAWELQQGLVEAVRSGQLSDTASPVCDLLSSVDICCLPVTPLAAAQSDRLKDHPRPTGAPRPPAPAKRRARPPA